MDIIIKSFNRPYYLERCLRSIERFVQGDYKITILDDGTPPEYLDKIQELYPNADIKRSALYHDKVKAIRDHLIGKKKYSLSTIPIDLWIEQVRLSSDVFLLLEDDIWFTSQLCIEDYVEHMTGNKIVIIKLFWGNNIKVIKGAIYPLNHLIEYVQPKIPFLPEFVLKILFYNKFKIGSIFYKLGLMADGVQFQMPFYDLYGVAASFFNKIYWLYLWDRDQREVDESRQLLRAVKWYRKKRSKYAKSKRQLTNTSFITSVNNRPFRSVYFDMFHFNFHLNEAWKNGKFDSMEGFPGDFSYNYVKVFLENSGDERCNFSEWKKWTDCFKDQYRSIGALLD